jgi:2-polyprenyl-3-methyl-5-hydroxy-6-metoxy-1,4-benzoquinol methylase
VSLLLNAVRSIMAARREVAAGLPEVSREEAESDAADSVPDDVPGESAGPAWRLLSGQTGVQEAEYADIPRDGVRHLFRHEPRRLLDIGCASGAVAAGLKKSNPGLWAWGCELNANAAQIAATRLDHVTAAPRAAWTAEDLARVKTIDTVLLLDVLEHMYNPWAELEFLAKELPADAQVIVSLPNVGHIAVLEDLAAGKFLYQPTGILDITHVRFFTAGGMQAMFDETGFVSEGTWIVSSTPVEAVARYPVQVAAGKMIITVEDAEEWTRLNAIQFGFRLRPKKRAGV